MCRRASSKFATIVIVHAKQFNSASPRCRYADDLIALQRKMIIPVLLARMKEWDKFIVHKSCQIWPFVKIAPMAGKAQIGIVVRATVLPCDNMLHMKCDQRQQILMAVTIFTPTVSALAD